VLFGRRLSCSEAIVGPLEGPGRDSRFAPELMMYAVREKIIDVE
jgi:hypothetical protein